MDGGASKRVRALIEKAVLEDASIGLKSELKSMDGAIADDDGKGFLSVNRGDIGDVFSRAQCGE